MLASQHSNRDLRVTGTGEPGLEPEPGDSKSPMLTDYTTPQCIARAAISSYWKPQIRTYIVGAIDLLAPQRPRHSLRQQRIRQRRSHVSRAMQRSLAAQHPDLEPGLVGGRQHLVERVGAAPHGLGHGEQ